MRNVRQPFVAHGDVRWPGEAVRGLRATAAVDSNGNVSDYRFFADVRGHRPCRQYVCYAYRYSLAAIPVQPHRFGVTE